MQEHIIVRLLTRIFDFLLLNVLWVLCSIPVISLGASTTALYSVMLKIVENEEGYIIWDFLKAFKRNFRQSTTVWCILLGIGVALFADYQFVQNISGVMRTIGMVLLGMIVLVYIYEVVFVFPLIARFDNTTINMLKNAVLIPISRLPYAVFVLGLSGMCVCDFAEQDNYYDRGGCMEYDWRFAYRVCKLASSAGDVLPIRVDYSSLSHSCAVSGNSSF